MRRFSSKIILVGALLFSGLLACWLYWPTLRLPLIYDTLLHIRITGGLDLASVWLPTKAFGFYRPMTFFPMLLIQQLFDGYPNWLLHGNNILQHGLNAGLLAWLSWRLWPDWRRALAAGTIFAVFPFSYQAVSIYGHNVHPAITGLMLLGLHSYLTAVSRPNPRKWYVLTWFLFVVMVLTHETAVLFGGFAALVHLSWQPEAFKRWWLNVRQRDWRSLLRVPWLPFILAAVVYLIVYQFLPIYREPLVDSGANSYWLNLLYLLQAAVFPLAWFAHLLPSVNGELITLLSGGLVMAASLWLAWRRPVWRAPLLLAWGWWAAASLLIGITLPTDYLLRGPRLLYLGSVGVALLWAHLLATVWSPKDKVNIELRGVAWTAVLAFILISSSQFVRTKLTEYAQLTQPVTAVRETVHSRNSTPDDEIVLINLPQWLDVPPNTYPIGVEFVAMLGDYLFAEELIGANLPGQHPVWAISVPELQSSQSYAYGIQDQHEWPGTFDNRRRHYFITSYLPDGPQTTYSGYILPQQAQPPIPPPNPIAQFEAYLLTEATARACNGRIQVQLRWLEGRDSAAETTSIFVQVLSEDGRLLAQADGPPLGIRPGLLNAPPDSLLYDWREITLAAEETAVPHTVLVGAYDFASGERSSATSATGQPLPDNAWRVPITTCP
ncbi:MAG: hypothetical protein H6653_14325 [Ardenticatenaceae bacterium]|nr:hypothetical protein [Ardenticatenaceae bacterium]